MCKKFLLSSFFLVFNVVNSAEMQADKKISKEMRQIDRQILQELPDSSLVKFRCLPCKKYWDACSGNNELQYVYDEQLCDMIANALQAAANYSQIIQAYPQLDSLVNILYKPAWIYAAQAAVIGLFKDEPQAVVKAEMENVRLAVDRLLKYGLSKK